MQHTQTKNTRNIQSYKTITTAINTQQHTKTNTKTQTNTNTYKTNTNTTTNQTQTKTKHKHKHIQNKQTHTIYIYMIQKHTCATNNQTHTNKANIQQTTTNNIHKTQLTKTIMGHIKHK